MRELLLDLSGVTNASQLHELLASALRFPDYYGRNWDAFDECVADPEQSAMPDRLVLKETPVI
jgi:RNAse (barnase) inhibitor barstar